MNTDRFQQRFTRYFRRIVGRHHLAMTLASLVVTAAAIVVVATQWNISSDFQELLPGDSEAAQAMEEVADRVGSSSSLFVVIDSPDMEANQQFADEYARQLRDLDDIAVAHFHNDKTFFEQHQLLYVDVDELHDIHERIEDELREQRRRQNPLYADLGTSGDDDPVDTSSVDETWEEMAHQNYREYLEAEDGYSLTIVVRFSEASTDLETTHRLLDEVRRLGDELNPQTYHDEMTLEYGGGLVHREGEYSSIVDDIQLSAVFTLLGLFVVISLYFRRTRAVALMLIPLAMAVLWTFAAAFLLFGQLTTISMFVFAILLGLGIDFSIHLLNGYDRARLEGESPIDALVDCYGSVGKATIVGGATTFATFVVLSFAQFRGLSQFGQVSAIGVIMMVLAVTTTLPAMILTLQNRWPHQPDRSKTAEEVLSFERWFHRDNLAAAAPWLLGIGVALSALAIWQLPNLEFEENFRQIGEIEPPWHDWSTKSTQEKRIAETESIASTVAGDVQQQALQARRAIEPDSYVPDRTLETTGDKYTSALRGQHSSTPTLLLTDDKEDAARLYDHLEAVKADDGLETVRSLTSIHAFSPGDEQTQRQRLDVIEQIEETLQTEKFDSLDDEDRRKLQRLRELTDVDEPVSIYDMPNWSKDMFREAGPRAKPPAEGEQFAFEYLIYVNEAIDHMIGDQARQFLGEIQQAVDDIDIDVRIGSQSFIYTSMLDEIRDDGARMLAIALLVVFAILSLYFRSPLRAAIALIPLTIGAIWMLGFAAWFGIRLDFFNVAILPVIIGIGIDDGLHFYHRYRDRGRGSIMEVTYHVGAAVGMTTITSMIGFGGLAITDYAGLQSLGYLAVTGLAAAFFATVLLLPALLWVAEKIQFSPVLPAHHVDDDKPPAGEPRTFYSS